MTKAGDKVIRGLKEAVEMASDEEAKVNISPDAIRTLADTLEGYWVDTDPKPSAAILRVAITKLRALETVMAAIAEWDDVETVADAMRALDRMQSD